MLFENNIKAILDQTWPMLIIITVIALSMRIVYYIKTKKQIVFYKELLMYFFIIYIMCFFYVVTFQDVSWSSSNFTPFKEIFRYDFGTRLFFKNVLGNMIMFIPYGFFVSYILKLEKWYSITSLTLLTSLTIETTQLVIGRVFDVDDIMLNILGGLLGYSIYYVIVKLKSKLPKLLKKQYIYNIIMMILVILIIIYLISIVR